MAGCDGSALASLVPNMTARVTTMGRRPPRSPDKVPVPNRSADSARCSRVRGFVPRRQALTRARFASAPSPTRGEGKKGSTAAERIVSLVFPVAALVIVGDLHRDHV